MRNRLTSTALLMTMGVGLGACGRFDKKKDKAGRKVGEVKTELVGTWTRGCEPVKAFGIFTLGGQTAEMGFAVTGDFSQTTRRYMEEGCQRELVKHEIKGTYSAVGNSPSDAQQKNLNITVHSVFATPPSDFAAAHLNDKKYCDKTDWRVGEAQEVTGRDCQGTKLSAGQVLLNLYQISGSELYLGQPYVLFLDTSVRPAQVDKAKPFRKK